MEIIFTLILLIGFGINSHRYDVKKQELPKEVLTSNIQQEIDQKKIGQQSVSKEKADVTGLAESSVSFINKTKTEAIKSTIAKGKYISVRIHDGNG